MENMQATVKMPFNEVITVHVEGYAPNVTQRTLKWGECSDFAFGQGGNHPAGYVEFKTWNEHWTVMALSDGKEIAFRNCDLLRLLAFFGREK